MLEDAEFYKICAEVYEVLKCCPKEMLEKIPSKTWTMIMNCKDENVKVEIDPNQPIWEQNISDEAILMILEIAYKCWYNDEERQELREALGEMIKNMREET